MPNKRRRGFKNKNAAVRSSPEPSTPDGSSAVVCAGGDVLEESAGSCGKNDVRLKRTAFRGEKPPTNVGSR